MLRSNHHLSAAIRRSCEAPRLSQLGALGIWSTATVTQVRTFIGDSKNPYTILGVKQGATKDQVKKAYRVMARKHHPDAPGGSHEKFQEIQQAYEEVKSGVWIPKGGSGSGEGGATMNRYQGFRYTSRNNKEKVSYDDFYAEMHGGGRKKGMDFDEEPEEGGAKKARRANPLAGNEKLVQAWFRVIIAWTTIFCTMRVILFLCFPPKHHHTAKKPLPDRPRKPPPPKPLAQPVLV